MDLKAPPTRGQISLSGRLQPAMLGLAGVSGDPPTSSESGGWGNASISWKTGERAAKTPGYTRNWLFSSLNDEVSILESKVLESVSFVCGWFVIDLHAGWWEWMPMCEWQDQELKFRQRVHTPQQRETRKEMQTTLRNRLFPLASSCVNS